MSVGRTSRRIAVGLAAVPFVFAAVAGLRAVAQAARRTSSDGGPPSDVPAVTPSAGLAAAVALDTLITLPMPLLASAGSAAHYERSSAELDEAVRFYRAAGWLDDPAGRHPEPPALTDVEFAPRAGRRRLEELRFDSGWQPEPDEPGGDRWEGFDANRVVTVRLLRHGGGARPWLIAIHGQGMGRRGDHRMLRVQRLHEELGLNIALPVLPLHGPRAEGTSPDQLFVSNVYPVNNVLGLTQAVWDVRRLSGWLRTEQQATAVGVLGLSLGSYVCSLLSTVDADLACVVALVPTSDLDEALRSAPPALPAKRRLHAALYDDRATQVHRVVSPLARPCLVPHERRHIVAGKVDHIAPPAGAAELWRHWDRPSILWRDRGHVTTGRGAVYDAHLKDALTQHGLRARSD